MLEIDIPDQPEMSQSEKIDFATEVAFNAFVDQAKKLGVPLNAVMGLMYLPTPALTWNLQQSFRAIAAALKAK